MQLRQKLMLFSLIFFVLSCSNYDTYKEIQNMYPREDTGIKELIRIDGYYYESSEEVYSPSVFKKDGELKRYSFRFNSHEDIQKTLQDLHPHPGYYTIDKDTIKTKWAFQVYHGQHTIYEEYFVVLSDTTIQRIYYAINDEESEAGNRSKLYKFQPFDGSGLK